MTDFLQKLLNGEKVEWKKLGEVCEVLKGKQLNKTELMENGKYPAYNGGVAYSGFTNQYNVEKNTTIISQGGASAGFVQFVETNFWANAHCYYLKPNIEIVNKKYIFYFVKNNQDILTQYQFGAGIPALNKSNIETLPIPIPPLSVQKEIVEILDALTTHTAELTTELATRKKQYEYYRNQLLNFEQKVEWKKLGEVCELKRGTTITEKTKTDGDIPVISGGQRPAYYNGEYNRDGETITVAGSGAYAGHVMYWNEPIFVSDAFSVNPNLSALNARYVYHFLLNNQSWIYNLKKGSGVPHVYPKDLATLQIPIPPLSVQKEIVETLDALTTHTAELTTEHTTRSKQYSYYRDKLLNFEL